MTKPYPTWTEVRARMGSGSTQNADDIIRHACDLDRERREAPAEIGLIETKGE